MTRLMTLARSDLRRIWSFKNEEDYLLVYDLFQGWVEFCILD